MNCIANDCESIEIKVLDANKIKNKKKYDLVCANIITQDLIEMAEKIISKIKKAINGVGTKAKQIRELIENAKFPKEMREEILEAYDHLDVKEDDFKQSETVVDILKTSREPLFVAVRSSATAEDLADASFAGQQDTFLNVKGNSNLLEAVKKAFSSLFTSRATYYRNKKGFNKDTKLAVIVQKMINSEKSGVIFSKDPSYNKYNILIESVFGLGEGIVSGKITPDRYTISNNLEILDKKIVDKKIAIIKGSSGEKEEIKLTEEKSNSQTLKENEIKKLSEIALNLEKHYKKSQNIEFAIEGKEIYIVQTRAITTINKGINIAKVKELKGEVILTGLAASPGISFGKTKIVKSSRDLEKINQGDVLIMKMTNPEIIVAMQKASAIITDEGGITSHAAIVSREMGIPSVVGTREATIKIKENEIITVNGFTGKVYKGKVSDYVLELESGKKTNEEKENIKIIIEDGREKRKILWFSKYL